MTAKSRRRKFDKRRKSDEHPQPRRRKEADRPEEGARVIRDARIQSVSLVKDGEQAFPEARIHVDGLEPRHVIYDEAEDTVSEAFVEGHQVELWVWGNGYSIYAGETAAEQGTRVHAESEKAVRTAGAPDAAVAG